MHAYWFIIVEIPLGYGKHVICVTIQSSEAKIGESPTDSTNGVDFSKIWVKIIYIFLLQTSRKCKFH
jgi:hypothetical protein